MVKMIKLLALAKFGSLRGSTTAFLKFWQSTKIGKILKLGVALVLGYLLTD